MNIINRFFIFCSLFCCVTMLSAQKLDHVLGDVIVQIPKQSSEALFQRLQHFEGKATNLRYEQLIAYPMQIWLLHFDHTTIHEERFLRHIQNLPFIEIAQYNHLTALRAVPNDPLFTEQWQYINDGSNSGQVGCDLDMDEAWDITTGGLTVNGDTIVVCVIDGGIDLDHEDMADNIWVNHAEIPNNGIDDDNNGYEDDYLGWNVSQNSDNVEGSNHGTAVAGIVGAKGNNNIGVSGVNWDVKVMVVRGGSSDEAEVIKAYAYPLTFRTRYNETAGTEGAFVVATNSSWGTDFGNPDEAPLWCAFYDTLGVAGILNCGATSNSNIHVDVDGDLPTACSSDYLVAVTNVDRSCTKVTAGFGANSIDLGAFGEGTYTIRNGNNYAPFGGTSGATPHVAGAVALMYSAPCEALASLASNDPGAAALLVKEYILEGVTPNESLDGITLTGGVLNIKNSLDLVIDNCSSCPLPSSIKANDITDVSAQITWIPSEPSVAINFRYREVGSSAWNTLNNITENQLALNNLNACTDYQFQIETVCTEESSGFSNFFTFKTDGCCEAPTGLNPYESTDSSISVSWNSVLAATGGYTLRYRPVDGGMWSLIISTDTELTISDLDACTNYEIQVRSICATGPTAYSPSATIFTIGCGACADLGYCAAASEDVSSEWIEVVQFGDINNVSPSNENAFYTDYTHLSTVVRQGESYTISLTPGYANSMFWDYFRVWIDYNQDGDFEEDNELAFDAGTPTQTPISGTITIPEDTPIGSARMRVIMKWVGSNASGDTPPESCENSFGYGEVEDYCVTIDQALSANQVTPPITNVRAFPNPFSKHISVNYTSENNQPLEITLYTIQGQVLTQKTLGSGFGHQTQQVEINDIIPTGVYLLEIKTDGHTVHKKLIKE